ncbi:hypothetical protein HCU64_02675 [Methylobacterium sp. C25]|nr:hypothetical protein [Methylobacterium sp. C25]
MPSQIRFTSQLVPIASSASDIEAELSMSQRILVLTAVAAIATGATISTANAQGYGSTGSVAASLGATAGPPIPQGRTLAGDPVSMLQPATTGSLARGDRTWSKFEHARRSAYRAQPIR